MTKPTLRELRCELKEVMMPVMTHIHDIIENGRAPKILEYEHRGEKLQAQFHVSDKGGLTVYVMYWYELTIAFKLTPEELATVTNKSIERNTDEFVRINELLIEHAYCSKPTLH